MRFTIRNKLFLGFGVLLALMLAASLLALSNISRVGDGAEAINDEIVPTVELLGTLKADARPTARSSSSTSSPTTRRSSRRSRAT